METVPQSSRESQAEIAHSWLDAKVSIVKNVLATETSDTTAAGALANIRNGKFRAEVERIRDRYARAKKRGDNPKDAIKPLKRALPGVLWSGKFSTRKEAVPLEAKLVGHSGLLCADLDNIPADRLPEVRAKLITSPHTLAVFLSPSGTGLKVVFKVPADAESHKSSFDAVKRHVGDLVGLAIDENCKDVTRLCLVSFDPELWIRNDEAKELTVCTHRTQMPHRTHTPHSTHNSHTVGGWGVVALGTSHEAVEIAIPRAKNTNHRCLCKLAGALLAVQHNTGKSIKEPELRDVFNQWHAQSKRFLDRKQSKDQYLMEFMDAWGNIKYPLQKSATDVAWERAEKAAVPPEAVAKGLTDPKICRMISFCRELQLLQKDKPFFLSPYTVKEYFRQTNHSTAAVWLGGLCKMGILTKIQAGSPRVWAASYRFNFAKLL